MFVFASALLFLSLHRLGAVHRESVHFPFLLSGLPPILREFARAYRSRLVSMSSYDNSGPQWIRPRTLVEKWVASWAPSEEQIRANWIAEATKQQKRAEAKKEVLALRRNHPGDNAWWLFKTQQDNDAYIETKFDDLKNKAAKADEE